ncbi:MAG: hypothetical protein PHI53_00775 [Candidatus Pacebacteria bacterium]|nr:hypothetical protein [Candidatus Paceibacterota bacterium]
MKSKYLILILIAAIIVVLLWLMKMFSETGLKIITDKNEYASEEVLKLRIENDSNKKLCFSSCYPYYMEIKENNDWKRYSYNECSFEDKADKCIDVNGLKGFQLNVPKVSSGTHRLAVSVCISCNENDDFKEESFYYSNEFIIK